MMKSPEDGNSSDKDSLPLASTVVTPSNPLSSVNPSIGDPVFDGSEFIGIAQDSRSAGLAPALETGKAEARNTIPVLPPSYSGSAAQQSGLFLSQDSYSSNHATPFLSTPSQAIVATPPTSASSDNTGRWTALEHERFLEGLRLYGKNWKSVSDTVQTRTVVQTRTHAQKYFQKSGRSTSQHVGNSDNEEDGLDTSFQSQSDDTIPGYNRSVKHTRAKREKVSRNEMDDEVSGEFAMNILSSMSTVPAYDGSSSNASLLLSGKGHHDDQSVNYEPPTGGFTASKAVQKRRRTSAAAAAVSTAPAGKGVTAKSSVSLPLTGASKRAGNKKVKVAAAKRATRTTYECQGDATAPNEYWAPYGGGHDEHYYNNPYPGGYPQTEDGQYSYHQYGSAPLNEGDASAYHEYYDMDPVGLSENQSLSVHTESPAFLSPESPTHSRDDGSYGVKPSPAATGSRRMAEIVAARALAGSFSPVTSCTHSTSRNVSFRRNVPPQNYYIPPPPYAYGQFSGQGQEYPVSNTAPQDSFRGRHSGFRAMSEGLIGGVSVLSAMKGTKFADEYDEEDDKTRSSLADMITSTNAAHSSPTIENAKVVVKEESLKESVITSNLGRTHKSMLTISLPESDKDGKAQDNDDSNIGQPITPWARDIRLLKSLHNSPILSNRANGNSSAGVSFRRSNQMPVGMFSPKSSLYIRPFSAPDLTTEQKAVFLEIKQHVLCGRVAELQQLLQTFIGAPSQTNAVVDVVAGEVAAPVTDNSMDIEPEVAPMVSPKLSPIIYSSTTNLTALVNSPKKTGSRSPIRTRSPRGRSESVAANTVTSPNASSRTLRPRRESISYFPSVSPARLVRASSSSASTSSIAGLGILKTPTSNTDKTTRQPVAAILARILNFVDVGGVTLMMMICGKAVDSSGQPLKAVQSIENVDISSLPLDEDVCIEMCVELLKFGGMSSLKVADAKSRTCLHYAVESNAPKICQWLLERDLTILNNIDAQGNTSLHLAAKHVNAPVIKVLVQFGAHCHGRNHLAQSVLDVGLYNVIATETEELPDRHQLRSLLLNLEPRLRTLVLYHDECLEHAARRSSDWEGPDRLTGIMKTIKDSTIFNRHDLEISSQFLRATVDLLRLAHSAEYIQLVDELSTQLQSAAKETAGVDNGADGDGSGSRSSSVTVPIPLTPHIQKKLLLKPVNEVKKQELCDTSFSIGTLKAARRAVGAVVHAVDRVLLGLNRNAFCAVRPPGHHSGYMGLLQDKATEENNGDSGHPLVDKESKSCGFCIFNNIAIGALHALEHHNVERVAVIDLDVHHGNGTEDVVRQYQGDASRLLFFSMHLFEEEEENELNASSVHTEHVGSNGPESAPVSMSQPDPTSKKRSNSTNSNPSSVAPVRSEFFPGSGRCNDQMHNIVNVPISPMWRQQQTDTSNPTSGRKVFRQIIAERLLPTLRAFHPQLILLSTGFDTAAGDVGNCHPVAGTAGLDLTCEDFEWTTSQILHVADICCSGRVVSVLEGGYGARLPFSPDPVATRGATRRQTAPSASTSGASTANGSKASSSGSAAVVVEPNKTLDRSLLAKSVASHVKRLIDPDYDHCSNMEP